MAWCATCRKEREYVPVQKFPEQKGTTPPTPEEPEGVEYLYRGSAWGCPVCHTGEEA